MESKNNNIKEEKKKDDEFNSYANPYDDLDLKENEEKTEGNNNNKLDENKEKENENLNNNSKKAIDNEEKSGENSNKDINNETKNNKEDNNENIKAEKKDTIINENNKDLQTSNNFNINKSNNNINNNMNQKIGINNKIKKNNNSQNINNKNLNNANKNINGAKAVEKKNKLYTIKETGSHIYVENTKKTSSMAIEKSFNKIYSVKDFTEMLNLNPMKTYQVDSILGIIDINGNNKYLLVVSSSQFIANILGADIYNILEVDLIQITLFNEVENEKKRILGVKKLFQSRNFYYSNEVDLSNSNIFNKNKKHIISDYCINRVLLKYFFDNLIPNEFYSKIIYGYVGFKKNIEIINDKTNIILLDNLIIEKVNKHLNFNTDIPNQMKEIELVSVYKSKNYITKQTNINIFSFMIYVSNEKSNSKIAFNPWNNFIMNELSQYGNIVCIINNNINVNLEYNININNNQMGNIIFNSNTLGQKVKLLNFTSDWKKNMFFESNINSNIYIKSNSISSNIMQEYIFWFIDINNMFHGNDCCFNSIIRIMWRAIQEQIEFMNLGKDIGKFNKNNTGVVCGKFKEIIMNYHQDLDINKKKMYKSQVRKQLQKVYDFYFNKNNNNNNSNNNLNVYDNNMNSRQNNDNNTNKNNDIDIRNSFNKHNLNAYQNLDNNQNHMNNQFHQNNINHNFNNQNNYNKRSTYIHNKVNNTINSNKMTPKLSVLCITWNVAGIPSENKYDIRDLFTRNIFYQNNQAPDVIVIGLEEIVELDFYNIFTITTNEDSVFDWTNNITSTLNDIYPFIYKKFCLLHLIGIYCICFTKSQLKEKINLINTNVIKTGLFGTLGNKGYLTFSLKYMNNIISFAIAHLEAGKSNCQERIDTLKQILDTKINNYSDFRFRNSDYWIILGDLNFRIETSFEMAIKKIQNKEYKDLIRYDQFYVNCKRDRDMAIVIEGPINFAPTYKYVPGSNNYINDSEKMRIPSYTDRILFVDKRGIKNIIYKSIPTLMYSDHRPVYAGFEIDLIGNNIIKRNNYNNNYNIPNNNFNNNRGNDYNNFNIPNSNFNNNRGNNNIQNFDDYYNYNIDKESNFNDNNYNNINRNNQNNINRNYQNFNNMNINVNNNFHDNQTNYFNRTNNQKNNYNPNFNNFINNNSNNNNHTQRNNNFNNNHQPNNNFNNNNKNQNLNSNNNHNNMVIEQGKFSNNQLKNNDFSKSRINTFTNNYTFKNNDNNNNNNSNINKQNNSNKKTKPKLSIPNSDKSLNKNNIDSNKNINNDSNNNNSINDTNNKTYIFFEKEEEIKIRDGDNNKDDDDNIEKLMQFFK